ncbi:MAG: L-fucose/L-arabinose isomerase family protein [Rubrobacteraceae bacterium]|nr:L-fucose/L-arabinose isomerase family protein [Rubrobacteraceae bacterium]
MTSRPKIGLLGIMQALYDEMLPGITERQANYAQEVASHLSGAADVRFPKPARSREDIEEIVELFEREKLDGIMIVMLTYGPAMRATRALANTRLPVMLANIQPEPHVTAEWDMGDMTYNQGVHGAQDTANALVRAGVPFRVASGDWRSPEFGRAFEEWARAAAAVTAWRRLKVAIFGYAMNGMGDIRVDETTMLRELGPEINFLATGDIHRAMQRVSAEEVKSALRAEDERFEIDENLTPEEREDSARMQLAIKSILDSGGFGAYSTHFDAIGEDGRFSRLPLAAASNLMAEGYGYGAEGDACSAALVSAGHILADVAHFTEMYALDYERDAILMSHMGEGNWRIARDDEKPRLIHRELGIGRLGPPPTVLFRIQPGPATIASLAPISGGRFRLVVSEGEVIDSEVLPNLEMPYGFFRPKTGARACLDGWLAAGGTHHEVMTPGHHASLWRTFAELLGIEYREV